MPFEIFALPVFICFVIGLIRGLKTSDRSDKEN
jgi:hypothetical protein